jgi:hypothetical protein
MVQFLIVNESLKIIDDTKTVVFIAKKDVFAISQSLYQAVPTADIYNLNLGYLGLVFTRKLSECLDPNGDVFTVDSFIIFVETYLGFNSGGIPQTIDLQEVTDNGNTTTNSIEASSFIKSGGTSSEILMADGSVITAGANISITGGLISSSGGGAGGGNSVNFYLNGSVSSSVPTYYQMSTTPVLGGGTNFPLSGDGLIAQFLTDIGSPNRLDIPAGAWNFEMYFNMSSSGGTPKFYIDLLKYNGSTFTTISSGILNPETISGGTSVDLYLTSLAVPQTTLLSTDRLAVRVYIVDNSGGRTATLHTEDSNLCEIITTLSYGITSLNGLTVNSQNFVTSTSGTDFNIVSSGNTHRFDMPSASTSARGVVTVNNQSFSGLKNFTDNIIVNTIRVWRGNNNSATNIGIGLDTLIDSTGNQNTVIGYQASSSLVSASSFATALGYQALKNILGNNNTGIGHSAGSLITNGFQNTFIGALSGGIIGQLISAQNSTAIGYNAFTTKNNQVVLGNALVTETVLRGKIDLDSVPTTSAGAYDILTRNISTGIIEKILSSSLGITLSAIGSTPNANGSTITGTVLNLQPANASFGGVITTGSQTIAGAKTLSTAPILSSLTSSEILALDASNNIQSLAVATYPDLTELSYVKGVTSSVQTQIDGKLTSPTFIDYSATSTVVGWTTFTQKIIKYSVIGKLLIVEYFITGTSNATTTSFTLPQASATVSGMIWANNNQTQNNAVSYMGYSNVLSNSSTATFGYYPTGSSITATWTASGTKTIRGLLTIEIA